MTRGAWQDPESESFKQSLQSIPAHRYGGAGRHGRVAVINGHTIAETGKVAGKAKREIDADGLAVTLGFVIYTRTWMRRSVGIRRSPPDRLRAIAGEVGKHGGIMQTVFGIPRESRFDDEFALLADEARMTRGVLLHGR